jgi:hypothetical protein
MAFAMAPSHGTPERMSELAGLDDSDHSFSWNVDDADFVVFFFKDVEMSGATS